MTSLHRGDTRSFATMAPRLRREALASAALFTLMLFGLSLLLIAWRSEQLLTQLSQERVTRLLQQVTSDSERSMRFGVGLADQQALPGLLERVLAQETLARAIWVISDRGEPLSSAGDPTLQRLVQPTWTSALLASPTGSATSMRNTSKAALMGSLMRDATGANAGVAWLAFDLQPIREQAREATFAVLLRSLPLAVITFATVWWVLLRWSTRALESLESLESSDAQHGTAQHHGGLRMGSIILVCLLVLSIAPAGMVWIAREAARPLVAQQLEDNADDVAQTLAGELERALRLGIPWVHLNGVQALFAQQLKHAPELSYIALSAGHGAPERITWNSAAGAERQSPADLQSRSVTVSGAAEKLVVGYSLDHVNGQLRGMMIDLVLAFVIAIVLMRELTRGLWRKSLLHPLLQHTESRIWQRVRTLWGRTHVVQAQAAENDARLAQDCVSQLRAMTSGSAPPSSPPPGDTRSAAWVSGQLTLLRLAVFLIALSEELLRPFFTVFASELQTADSHLSPAMVAGMPVAAFMATLALTQVLGPSIARRFDLRWSLMAAALIGVCAMAATSLARDVNSLVALRALAGVAYGLGFIIAQTAVVRITATQRRARGLSELSAAIVAAGIVGPPFGGMIAARAGDAMGFLACALCLVAAALVAMRLSLRRQDADQGGAKGLTTTGGWRGYVAVLREPRAILVILGAALPARLVAVTVLSVVVPLYMSALQQPPAVAGRVLLLYFLCFACTSTLIAHWSDLTGQRKSFIYLGGLLSVLACMSMMVFDGATGMALCCALLGFGQAFQSAPQIALATEVFEPREGAYASPATPEQALAAFRFMERAGSIVAPFVTAIAITIWGYAGAVLAVGLLVGVATLCMMVGLRSPTPIAMPSLSSHRSRREPS
ncbi:MFS transporter [Diaphorobacter caeni]|uniref:MFS transporter n=1 Tax=Diaphorobacter caeni TaxID=2784387 RepID=UPI00188E0FF8|nr:MFS transporter [Diaphorobacter caeni]MBF5005609.1 MFS transporter [Diaphorobacter caeni]